MNGPIWKRLSGALAALLFCLAVALMLRPWFLALAYSVEDQWQAISFLGWLLLVLTTGILFGGLGRQREQQLWAKILGLVVFAGAHGAFLALLGFNLYLHIPLTLILLLFSLRYWLYYSTADFSFDFGFLAGFVLFTLLMQARLPIILEVSDVLLFFAAGFSLIVLFHVRNMEREGFKPHYPLLLVVMVGFVGAVLVLGTLGGLPLGVELTQGILALFRLAWRAFSQVILWLLFPVLWLLGPVMEWLKSLIPEGEPRGEETMLMQDGMMDQLESTAVASSSWSVPPWLYWIVGTAVLLFAVILVLRKLQIPSDEEEEGMEEERSSVFSQESLRRDIKDLLRAGSRVLQRLRRSTAAPTEPTARVRWSYRRFLQQVSTLHPRPAYMTPRSYQEKLLRNAEQDPPLQTLTELYQQARYRGTATVEDAEEAEAAGKTLKDSWKNRRQRD